MAQESIDDYEVPARNLGEMEECIATRIREVLTLGHSTTFGLIHKTGTVDFPEEAIGSWLVALGKKKRIAFFEMNDNTEELVQKKGKQEKGRTQKIPYNEITAIVPRVTVDGPYSCSFEVTAGEKIWELQPIQDDDSDVVVHWVAALRYRTKLFDPSLLEEQNKALRAILWFQSQYRMKKAKEKAQRRRDRRAGFINKAMGWLNGGYEDSDSDSANEEEEDDPLNAKNKGGFTSVLASIIQDAYATTFANTGAEFNEEALQRQLTIDEETKKKFHLEMRRNTTLLDKNMLKPLTANELEDEVWENQRWRVKGNWTSNCGNRSPFTDRLGRCGADTAEGVLPPMSNDWVVTQDFQIDSSGLNSARCGKDGWIYQTDFAPLETDLAKGKYHIKPGPGYNARHRRLYRRRALKEGVKPVRSPVLWHGWLGKKGLTTGRWTNRYCVLTNGMRINGKITGVSLSYFRVNRTDHMQFIESQDLKKWEDLTQKDWRTYNLDGAKLTQEKKNPEHFALNLSNERKLKRVFNAYDANTSAMWMKWIEHAVSDQEKRFTLTRLTLQKTLEMKKETSYDMIQSLSWSVLDCLVPTDIDKFVHLAYFDTTFLHNLNKALRVANFREKVAWKYNNGKKGDRREYEYILPRQKTKIANYIGRTRVLEKFRIDAHDPGVGIHVTKSIEFPDTLYGPLFRCRVRTVVTAWKGERARVCVSMDIDLKTKDQGIHDYVESMMRKYLLQYYVDVWMPLLGKAIKHNRRKQTTQAKDVFISGPGGQQYKVAEVSMYKKGKQKKQMDLKPIKGYDKIKEYI